MKKSILAILTCTTLLLGGCGATEKIINSAKEQIEWTEENNARTNGMSAEEAFEDTVEDMTGVDISGIYSTEETETVEEVEETISTDGDEYTIGDTVPLISVNEDGSQTKIDLTVTGCEPVFNSEKNVTAIFYTVTSKEGSELKFDNTNFTCYADDTYVSPTYWEEYNPYSYGILMPGTTYEGVYVADVDPNTVSKIDLYSGDIVWHVQENISHEYPQEIDEEYNPEEALPLSGLYTDGTNSCVVMFYSYPEGQYVGGFEVVMDGVSYYGDLEYDAVNNAYFSKTNNLDSVCLIFTAGETPTVTVYLETSDGLIDTVSNPMIMTEHYES